MRSLLLSIAVVGFTLLSLLAVGCNQASAPPAPLSLADLPGEFDKAFAPAATETRNLAGQVAASVRGQDYNQAFVDLQSLAAAPNLTKAQARLLARGRLTLNEALAAAQSRGDAKAAAVLQYQHLTK